MATTVPTASLILAAALLGGGVSSTAASNAASLSAAARNDQGAPASSTNSPSSTIRAFYGAINRRAYRQAYGYLAARGRPAYGRWASGYRSTWQVTIHSLSVPAYRIAHDQASYTCVGVQFSARNRGNITEYGGWYLLGTGQPRQWRIVLAGSRIAFHGTAQPPLRAACAASIPTSSTHGLVACSAVSAVAYWQGAGSERVGAIVFTNRGSGRCALSGNFGLRIVSSNIGALPVAVVRAHGEQARQLTLRHGDKAESPVQWSNWCGKPTSRLSLRITMPRNHHRLSPSVRYGSTRNPHSATAPPCLNASGRSTVEISALRPVS